MKREEKNKDKMSKNNFLNLYFNLFLKLFKNKLNFLIIIFYLIIKNLGIGDWGLGIGDWGLGPIPNPQSPIPNPQSPLYVLSIYLNYIFNFIKKLKIKIKKNGMFQRY